MYNTASPTVNRCFFFKRFIINNGYVMILYYREERRGVHVYDSGSCLGSCPDFNDDDNFVSIQQWTNSIFENNF